MCTCDKNLQVSLEKRVEQHEQTISQLIQMVALTNRQLMQLVQDDHGIHVRTPSS